MHFACARHRTLNGEHERRVYQTRFRASDERSRKYLRKFVKPHPTGKHSVRGMRRNMPFVRFKEKYLFAGNIAFDISEEHCYLAFSFKQSLDRGTQPINGIVSARRTYDDFCGRVRVDLDPEFHSLISFRRRNYTIFSSACKDLFADRSFFCAER